MRLRTTIILVILTAALAWFFLGRDPGKHGENPFETKRLFLFKRQLADAITLQGKDQTVTLQKRNGVWWITAPLEDRANPLFAEAMLENLIRMENIDVFKPSTFSEDKLKRAGLNSTSIQLAVSGGGRMMASCKVGGRTPVENSVYLTITHEKTGRLIHAARLPFAELARSDDPAAKKLDFLSILQNPPSAWRDPVLIRMDAAKVRRITLSAGTGIMEFKRDAGSAWELTKPLQARASEERVNAVLSSLLRIEARPAAKLPVPAADTSLPPMKVSIESEDRQQPVELTLQPGADPEAEITASVSDRPGGYLLPGKAAEVWKLQPNDLRDTHLAKIDTKSVDAIRIRSAVHPEVVLGRQGNIWNLSRLGKNMPANQERVSRLLSELNVAQIREFASDAATSLEPYGLHQPFLEVEWRAGNKSWLLQFGASAENRVYCRYDHEAFVYRINPALLSDIPADGVKWQGLGVLNLSTLAVRRIVITEGDSPAVSLRHAPLDGRWRGEVASQDISEKIDRQRANALLNKLATLNADLWVTDRTAGYEALKKPSLTVQIYVINPSKPADPPAPMTLTFAPSNPDSALGPFYGRLDDSPDIFLFSREQYREIIAPVLK